MEINKQDDYAGASNFSDLDDFNLQEFLPEEEDSETVVEEESFYRKLDEY